MSFLDRAKNYADQAKEKADELVEKHGPQAAQGPLRASTRPPSD